MNRNAAKQVVVAGHLMVDPAGRAAYLEDCRAVVQQARRAAGCLDFAISADLVDPGRINVLERWESQEAVETFRGSGPSEGQSAAIVSASVAKYDVDPRAPYFDSAVNDTPRTANTRQGIHS
jgi:quinol monooxygenase YgiN